MGKPPLTAKSLIRMVLSECVYDTKSNLGNAKAKSRWKQRFSSDHRSYATSSPVSILMGDRLGIPDDVSFLCSHLTRYITTVVVVVVVIVVIVDKERFPRNSSDNTTNLCLFQETRTSCLMITLSLCNRSNNWHMVSFQISDATVHKNITYTHSFRQILLSLIQPNYTNNFFQGTLYLSNGGWILTVVLALQPYRIQNVYMIRSQT